MSFFSKLSTEKNHLVCVATSYAAIAAIVRTYHGDDTVRHPVVLFSHTEPVEYHHGRNPALVSEITCQAMGRAISVCRKIRPDFDRLICAIGEPWVTTMSRSVHLEKKDPFMVTKKNLDDLITRDKKLFEQDITKDFPGRDIGLVQASRPVVWINGYQVTHPLGVQAASIDVAVAYSIADAGFMDELGGVFLDAFHRDDIAFISTDIAQIRGIPKTVQRTIVNLGGSTSVISVIDRGRSTFFLSLPSGLLDFEQRIAESFGITKSQISSVMNFATDEKLLAHERDLYYARIETAYAPMGDALRRAGMQLARHIGMLPGQGYVTGIPDWISVLKPLIEKDLGVELSDIPTGDVMHADGTREHTMLTAVILEALSKE